METKQITLLMDEQLYERVAKIADATERSMNQTIRYLMKRGLATIAEELE
jgi:hypothetical protein